MSWRLTEVPEGGGCETGDRPEVALGEGDRVDAGCCGADACVSLSLVCEMACSRAHPDFRSCKRRCESHRVTL